MTDPSLGRTYGGEAAEVRAARRRRQLLDAGLEIFGTVGYRKATVRQLCREARVADRYFYEVFANTEELLIAVYHDCLDSLQDAVLAAIENEQSDLGHLIDRGLHSFLATLESDPRIARVAWFEVLGVSAEVEAAYVRRQLAFGDLLLSISEQHGLAGRPWSDEQEIIVNAAVGGVSSTVMTWVYRDFEPPRASLVPALSRFLTSAAAAGLDS